MTQITEQLELPLEPTKKPHLFKVGSRWACASSRKKAEVDVQWLTFDTPEQAYSDWKILQGWLGVWNNLCNGTYIGHTNMSGFDAPNQFRIDGNAITSNTDLPCGSIYGYFPSSTDVL